MNNPFLEILIILLLLVANGIFAMSEIAVVSARKARLQQLAEEGDVKARTALELANNPNQFLSTVQVGITLVGILAGAFGGATLADELMGVLNEIPWLAGYSQAIAVGVVVVAITYFSLIIGELVPKRVALNSPERIAGYIAGPMMFLSTIATPVVKLLSLSTELVLRLLGIQPSAEPPVTEEELKVLIEQGTQSGVFAEAEQDMIEGVLRLGERRIGMLMTPRTHVIWIDIDAPVETIRQKIVTSRHTFFPVVRDSLDNVLGYVNAKDLLAQTLAGQAIDLNALLQEPLFVPERILALRVLELFKQQGTRIAFVIDEYGSVQGIVTDNDILEDIVGDIDMADISLEPQAVQREDGSWLLDGLLHIDDLKETLDIEELPDEEEGHYQTLAGFVINQMGDIPTIGQSFEWGAYRYEVVDLDGRRIDKVLATPLQTEVTEIHPETNSPG